ncbi:hypothetical protein [Microbacterium testaceum]|uniref:hypothetical protein n=1 Tax=Microbacterium testaceum TaxID=2033 RepID=UPI001247812C|nr:hypothetical protein [Microbacterium testaceum]
MSDAPPATTTLYWSVIACGAVLSVVVATAVSGLYYDAMGDGLTADLFVASVRGGIGFGLPTVAFVILGTVWFAPKLHLRKGWAILGSFAAPVVGWTLFGAVDSGFGPASLFAFYPVVGVVAGTASGLAAALASFLVPVAEPGGEAASGHAPDIAGSSPG